MIRKDVFEVPEAVQIKILKQGSIYMKEALLQKGSFDLRAEEILLTSEDLDFAKKYIAKYGLSFKAQEFLVRKGNKKLLLHFIRNYQLCPTAKILLIMKGNHEEVMALLKWKHLLDDTMAQKLLLRRNKEEIECYLHNQHPELLPA